PAREDGLRRAPQRSGRSPPLAPVPDVQGACGRRRDGRDRDGPARRRAARRGTQRPRRAHARPRSDQGKPGRARCAAYRRKDPVMTDKQAPTQEAAAQPKKRKWTRTLMWIGGPALVLAIAGYMYVTSGRFASTDNAYVQADRVTIAPQVSGRVVEVDVRENQPVKKGDVLFRIDQEPLQIAQARMQAQVESVKSLLDTAR